MDTDLKFALFTSACALLMITAFGLTWLCISVARAAFFNAALCFHVIELSLALSYDVRQCSGAASSPRLTH